MNKLILLTFLFGNLILISQAFQTINPISFKKVFNSVKPYNDLSSAYYSIKGLKLISENIDNPADVCAFVKSKLDQNNLESIYLATGIANEIDNCQLTIQNLEQTVKNAATSQNLADLYYYVNLAKNSKLAIDAAQLAKSVADGLKRDSSILNQAYALQISLEFPDTDKTYYNNIEDLLEQADEVDNIYLQYEGGVATTSLILDGIFKVAEKFKKFPEKFDRQRLTKFVNYLSSKRHTPNVKSAFNLLTVAFTLTNNPFSIPVVVNRISAVSVTQDKPNVVISVTNFVGRPLKDVKFNIETESANNQQANLPPLFSDKKQFTSKSSDGTTYEAKLYDSSTANQAGFYTIVLNVSPKVADKRLFLIDNKFEVKFLRDLEIVDVQVGVSDREQLSPKLTKLQTGIKLKDKLDADQNSKVYVRFALKEKSGDKLVEANQVFVRFSNQNSDREIIFLAEPNSAKQYSSDVDLTQYAKNFNYLNGVYTIQLIVSDPLVTTPLTVPLADIKLQFSDSSVSDANAAKSQLYAKKPEIKHLFREPEPTPSKLVSTLFSALCLLPLLILLILWFNIGFNFSRLQFSLSGIVFHVTLGGIFGLLYCYWAYLNMFQTLRYLSALAIVAFLSGKQLLSGLATSQKEKTN